MFWFNDFSLDFILLILFGLLSECIYCLFLNDVSGVHFLMHLAGCTDLPDLVGIIPHCSNIDYLNLVSWMWKNDFHTIYSSLIAKFLNNFLSLLIHFPGLVLASIAKALVTFKAYWTQDVHLTIKKCVISGLSLTQKGEVCIC